MNLGFTAQIEQDFDQIAQGKKDWIQMMKQFYFPLHDKVEEKEKTVTRAEAIQERILGTDSASGKPISVRVGRYSPMVQIGTKEDEEKPRFAAVPKGMSIHEITLEEALQLFALPRVLGTHESGEEIIVNRGRYGPYVKLGKDFFAIKEADPFTIKLEQAVQIIEEGLNAKAQKTLHEFGEIQVLQGKYGPYIKYNRRNFKIPKELDPAKLDQVACEKIIAEAPPAKKKRSRQ